jgi:hypothetical protein
MAGKVYKRQILLHSNSSEETEELDLIVKTGDIPIRAQKFPYLELINPAQHENWSFGTYKDILILAACRRNAFSPH